MAAMILVAIAWVYVVVMMAVAETMAPNGSVLGAFFTLLLYGVLPLGVVLYIMNSPARRRARRAREQAAESTAAPAPPMDLSDRGSPSSSAAFGAAPSAGAVPAPHQRGQAAGDAVAPVREPQ